MNDLYQEALTTFGDLFEEARQSAAIEPEAMVVSTATRGGVPSSRVVLLKQFDRRGFVFYSHLNSPKGRDLRENPNIAALFLWRELREAGIQVRIEGHAEWVDADESDAYFSTRPRVSQLGAWASKQSEPLASREIFEERLRHFETEFEGRKVPRPPTWGGIRIVPRLLEFWYGARFRLHERWRYHLDDTGEWCKTLFYP